MAALFALLFLSILLTLWKKPKWAILALIVVLVGGIVLFSFYMTSNLKIRW